MQIDRHRLKMISKKQEIQSFQALTALPSTNWSRSENRWWDLTGSGFESLLMCKQTLTTEETKG